VSETIREIAHLPLSFDALLFDFFQFGLKKIDLGKGFSLITRQISLGFPLGIDRNHFSFGRNPAFVSYYYFRFGCMTRGLTLHFVRFDRALTLLLITLIGIHITT